MQGKAAGWRRKPTGRSGSRTCVPDLPAQWSGEGSGVLVTKYASFDFLTVPRVRRPIAPRKGPAGRRVPCGDGRAVRVVPGRPAQRPGKRVGGPCFPDTHGFPVAERGAIQLSRLKTTAAGPWPDSDGETAAQPRPQSASPRGERPGCRRSRKAFRSSPSRCTTLFMSPHPSPIGHTAQPDL